MRRFFIEKKAIKENKVIITGKEAHHIKDVIRLKPGERMLGIDGEGKTYTMQIKSLSDSSVEAKIEKVSVKAMDEIKILLACALPKKSKIDHIIEKATELGVSEIIPLITEHTIVKIDAEKKAAKQKRWEKIAVEASKQCGRENLPKIYEAVDFKKAVEISKDLGYKKIMLPCLCQGSRDLADVLSNNNEDVAVFIGPEGDFSQQEIEYAKTAGFELVSLGYLILKVDTACLFSISAIKVFSSRSR